MPVDAYREKRRITIVAAAVNAVLAVVKIVGGVVGQSQALVVDGVHSLSDLASDGLILAAARIGARGPDSNHPFGHARFETAATLALAAILLLVAGGFAYDAVLRLLLAEQHGDPGWLALAVAVLSVVANEGVYQGTARVAVRAESEMLRANAWHHRSDALSSLVVIFGVLGAMAGLPWLDGVAALVVALMIGAIGWRLGWEAGRELVDTGLDADELAGIRASALRVDGVRGICDLRTRRMGPRTLVTIRVRIDPAITAGEAHAICVAVRRSLRADIDSVGEVFVGIDAGPEAVPGEPQ